MTMPSQKNIDGSLRRRHKAPKLEHDTDKKWSIAKIDVLSIPVNILQQKKTAQELDLQDSSEEEIRCLQQKDPFLYYSIPGVRMAKAALKEVDYSDVSALCHGVNKVSLTSQNSESQTPALSKTKVARRSCVSFECHTNLLMEDLLDDLSEDEQLLFGDDLKEFDIFFG